MHIDQSLEDPHKVQHNQPENNQKIIYEQLSRVEEELHIFNQIFAINPK